MGGHRFLHLHHSCSFRGTLPGPLPLHHGASRACPARRQDRQVLRSRDRFGGWFYPYPQNPEARLRLLQRQGARGRRESDNVEILWWRQRNAWRYAWWWYARRTWWLPWRRWCWWCWWSWWR